eukprot:751219-Hanusia_phi.AAC.4
MAVDLFTHAGDLRAAADLLAKGTVPLAVHAHPPYLIHLKIPSALSFHHHPPLFISNCPSTLCPFLSLSRTLAPSLFRRSLCTSLPLYSLPLLLPLRHLRVCLTLSHTPLEGTVCSSNARKTARYSPGDHERGKQANTGRAGGRGLSSEEEGEGDGGRQRRGVHREEYRRERTRGGARLGK